MQILNGQLVLSATDLVAYLACEHLTHLELGAARGQWKRPFVSDPVLDLLQKKGGEHERRYLESLETEGKSVVRLATEPARSLEELRQGDGRTREAMRSGVDVIYQATLFDGRWRGHPDFLVRVERQSGLGAWSYEPVDAKLARRVEAAALLQLSLYAHRVGELQGVLPERVSVLAGDGALDRHRLADYSAYYRATKRALEERLFGNGETAATYPSPVEHCRVCRWFRECADRRRADDHLCRVANITRTQTKRLTNGGIPTLTALARSKAEDRAPDMVPATFDRLRQQARLQQQQYEDGRVRYELIPPDSEEPDRGLAHLPESSAGDVFLDIENDPWAGEEGREYLLGTVVDMAGVPEYRALWAHSADEEKRSLERFLDFVLERLHRHPEMHVFHYGAYEEAALKRLVSRHGTREDELDRLLRGEVLVDLYAVVRQGVRVSQESYSLKKIEALYMSGREGPVTRPGFAIVEYERWLETSDRAILASIAAYNRDDCLSVWKLRSWLEERRSELQSRFGVVLDRPPIKNGTESETQAGQNEETRARVEALTRDLPADPSVRTKEQQARWLLAQLLDWHRREDKPGWWRYYDLLAKPVEELVADADALGDLRYEGVLREEKHSLVHRYSHDPEQAHKFQIGDHPVDPKSGRTAGVVVGVDEAAGTIDLKRGKRVNADETRALIPGRPIPTNAQRDALRRVADKVIGDGMEASGLYRAARDLLLRITPRVRGTREGRDLVRPGEEGLTAAKRLGLDLDESYLPIQGPPGSGKTFTGARMIVELLRHGKKVGIAATAHKAISNLVDEVCVAAREEHHDVHVIQRCEEEEASTQPEVTVAEKNEDVVKGLADGSCNVIAGTSWLFSRADLEGLIDVLFVDEAGQMSLANVVAMSGAARSLVLLGDPNQLPQVTKGRHPEGAGASALEHVLDGLDTIPKDKGLFLEKTWRLQPDLCRYISEAFYEGRLEPHPSTIGQTISPGPTVEGTGLRLWTVEHGQNSSRSPEEAAVVVETVAALIGRPWTNQKGETRKLTLEDILVVAPYNLQVGEIERRFQERFGVRGRVGTVDKFQGQEGALVLYSTATSSPDDAPRDIEFLYSRNRLNVALSRARALSVLVSSPGLFRIRCRTPEEMRMANAFCLLREASLTEESLSAPY